MSVGNFYDFLKLASEKRSGFDAFDQTNLVESLSFSLSPEQSKAFQSSDAKQISQYVLLEDNNLPSNAAISITIPITITWD